MTVRPATDTDTDPVGEVIATAFGHAGVAELWQDVRDEGLVRAELVAEVDHHVVGHVGLSHGWLDARRELVDILVLSPLSVLPDHQRSGLGTELLAAAVEVARAGGVPLAVLEGSPDFYGARGWEPAADHRILPASDRIPGPACRVVLFDAYEEWMHGRIVYRDVWWRHDSAGLRDPRLASVEQALGITPPD